MSVIEYPLGEIVELELFFKLNGMPVSGLSPKVALRRTDDNLYFDWGTKLWEDSPVDKYAIMSEVHGGLYQAVWDSTYVGQAPRVVVAEYVVEDSGYEGTAEDVMLFGVSETDPMSLASAVWAKSPEAYSGMDTFGGLLKTMAQNVTQIRDIEEGRWKIENNQMVFYKADNETEIMRFDLFEMDGSPTSDVVAERRRVQ